MLPAETIEKILSLCDGKSLYNARNVNHNWRQIVDYLTVNTKIWKYICYEEIPEDELIQYLEKFNSSSERDKFKDIYDNWSSWRSISHNVDFDIMLCPADVPRITCLAASGRFVAVGSEDGKVRIYNDSWDLLYTTRQVAVKVLDITFFNDGRDLYSGDAWPFIIISYKSNTLYIVDYEDRYEDFVHDVILYSVYKKYLCLVKRGGRISILELIKDADGQKKFFEVTYVRMYSPNEVTGIFMWNGVCTFLMNSDVKTLRYDGQVQPMSTVENKTRLKFCIKNNIRFNQTCQIYRSDIIISLWTFGFSELGYRAAANDKYKQLIELFILGPNETYSTKLFHTWEVFESHITCMYLYGNTFILGVDVGDVYFYTINSWKTFNIRKYEERLRIGKHPILSIDVLERKSERTFFIASSFNVHRVVGFSIVNRC